jgi:hypothetical protein
MTPGAQVSQAADHAFRAAGVLVTMVVKKRVWRSLIEYAAVELEAAAQALKAIPHT